MNRDKYEEAWTTLLAARRSGDIEAVHHAAEELAHAARVLVLTQQEHLAPCSHFMVVNDHCINCHEIVGAVGN